MSNSIYLLNKNIGNDYYASAKDALIDLCSELEKPFQHKHELLILTCYVNLDLLQDYVKKMRQCVKISKISLLFDFSEVYRIGPKEVTGKIQSISNYLNKSNIIFDYAYLFTSSLAHSKGYAVVQKDRFGAIIDGFTLITSANFTNPGFLGENIELSQASNAKNSVKDFVNTFDFLKEKFGKISLTQESFRQEKYLFKYALLESGYFLHKWAGNLKQELSIMYNLTESAQKEIKKGVPFDLNTNSFSLGKCLMRKVIDVDSLPEKLIPRSFITSYTIETFWGRWCPKEAWNFLINLVDPKLNGGESSKFKQFYNEFRKKTADYILATIKESAKPIQEDLQKNGHIKIVKDDHLDKWIEKIVKIREDGEGRLRRFFLGYENSSLPYTVEQKQSVLSLYDNLAESMDMSKTENKVREKVREAIDSFDLACIKLSKEDRDYITQIVNTKTSEEDEDE